MRDDLPGQLRLDGGYAAKPDDACKACARPMTPPLRKRSPKVKAKRRVFNLDLSQRDTRGQPVWLANDWKWIEFDEGATDAHADGDAGHAGRDLRDDAGPVDPDQLELPPF